MINVQGTFREGRGASGLHVNAVRVTSRLGTGTPKGKRPARLTGKPSPPAGRADPRRFAPPRRRPSKRKQIRHRQQFILWLQRWQPKLYARAKKSADFAQAREGTLDGLAGWWESFTDNLTEIGGAVLQYKTQKEILDVQMERMRQGLPPLQTAEYAPTVVIKPDPGTTAEITGAIGAGFGKLLPWLAVGGVGIYLLTRK